MSQWSLCLQSRQARKIVKIDKSLTTAELFELATQVFETPVETLKCGFPPRRLENGSTLVEDVVQNQERIQVEFRSARRDTDGGKGKVAGKRKAKSSNEPPDESNLSATSISRRGRPKRAAAQAASEAMPSIIKAQDSMMTKPSTSKRRSRRTDAAPKRKSAPRPKFGASAGDGRRLTDGATVVNPKSRRQPTNILQKSGSSDMGEALLGALNDGGKMGRVLRKGMANAVAKSYETGRAFSRLAAIQNQTFRTQVSNDEGTNGRLIITYKGTVDKSTQIDTVDCIPRDILEAVIQGIHASNQDALRVENLALLSPRVLWSLIYVIPNNPNVADCYRELLPNLDWSFLRRRAQQLSEKALENLRQEQEAKGLDENVEKAQDAISAVEHAMEHLQEHEKAERTLRLARAALARMQRRSSADGEWKLVTPDELDRDELRDCIQAAPPENFGRIPSIITRLIKKCQVRNWRELANKDVPSIALNLDDLGVSPDQVSKWVDKAQEESVDEIIVEICDGNADAVEILRDQARTGTPKDLANWRLIPEILLDELDLEGEKRKPTVVQLGVWSKRAHDVLQEHEWLDWYATPVG